MSLVDKIGFVALLLAAFGLALMWWLWR